MSKLTVAVFSYNRGTHLEHCLASLRRNMPLVPVVVYDDLSDDPQTQVVLRNLDVPLVQPEAVRKAQHGGLYANMARAVADVQTDYLMFFQDDMQIVRPVDDQDIADIDAIFAADPDCGFVSPLFMKGVIERKMRAQYRPALGIPAYRVMPEIDRASMRFPYSDVCIVHIARLKAAKFEIVEGEGQNRLQALSKFSQMPNMSGPFAFYCPEAPFFRNRKRSLSGKLASKMAQGNGFGFHDMTKSEVDFLRSRDLSIWPFAEDLLSPQNPQVRRPFVFQDAEGKTALRVLAKIEYLLLSGRRRLQRFRRKLGW